MRGVYWANHRKENEPATSAAAVAATSQCAGGVYQDAPQPRLPLRFQRFGPKQAKPLYRTRRTHPRVPAQVVVRSYLPST